MSSINSNEIISILKEEIENFDMMSKDSEVGTVITVGDGIASIYGIDHAMYGEIVTFENGLKGMVQYFHFPAGQFHKSVSLKLLQYPCHYFPRCPRIPRQCLVRNRQTV